MRVVARAVLAILAGAVLAGAVPAAAKVAVGDRAPSIELRDLDGRLFQLRDLAYAGAERPGRPKRFVLVDFFRTDCPPCKKALPHLAKLHETHAKLGVTVLLVAVKEDEPVLRAFLAENRLPFAVLNDAYAKAAKQYGIVEGTRTNVPATFLVDPDGVVRMVVDGVDEHLPDVLAPALERK